MAETDVMIYSSLFTIQPILYRWTTRADIILTRMRGKAQPNGRPAVELIETLVLLFSVVAKAVAVLGKNIWGAWPLIIWEATTAKRNYYRTN